jgi:uncharacterized protein
MRRSRIDYGRLVETALRTVVRDVLTRLAKDGAPPPHHFYVTFRTRHPGVAIPEFLRDRYPVDMTIVLQHQFWDLAVDEEGFAVTLSFSDQLQRLRVPYAAIKVFADPGVEFGLQFTIDDESETQGAEVKLLGATVQVPKEEGGETPAESGGAEIVTLDRFRKK